MDQWYGKQIDIFLPGDLACDILMCGVVQGQLSVFTDNEHDIYFDILNGYWKLFFSLWFQFLICGASFFNSLMPEQGGHHFADDIFKY